MEDKCYWWDRDLRQCMHVNCQITNCDGGTMLCNLYQKDFSYIKTSTINEPSSADYIPMTYVETGIKDSGERTEFPSGAVRDMHAGKGRMDLLPWHAIMEVSKHCENGAVKYGEHNVDREIPVHSLMDSGMRHAAKHLIGLTDKPHLVAACWNMLWALEMELTKPEMVDIPWRPDDDK